MKNTIELTYESYTIQNEKNKKNLMSKCNCFLNYV